MFFPQALLKHLYTNGSLKNTGGGVQFSLKNRLKDATFTGVEKVVLSGKEIPASSLVLDLGDGTKVHGNEVSRDNPIHFPLRKTVDVLADTDALPDGNHKIEIDIRTKPFGRLRLKVEEELYKNGFSVVNGEAQNGTEATLNGHWPTSAAKGSLTQENEDRIPRDGLNDYGESVIKKRQEFVEKLSGAKLTHTSQFSIDAQATKGNIENLVGISQIPLGIAGPLLVDGEHANGEFIIPMATTEGTLVASYNRGMKVLNLCGGVKTTVIDDAMQRAPVFIFESARHCRDFSDWIGQNFSKIKEVAETTSSVAKLKYIDPYLSGKFVYLRFNYFTGDAAGQNMVTKATFEACSWIIDSYKNHKIEHFFLEANFATDKKTSYINTLKTRGKKVIAEAIIERKVLRRYMRVEPEALMYHSQVGMMGSFMSGTNNNGGHSANALTAMFIATGQDVANIAESSAANVYCELTRPVDGDLYVSVTLPSIIIATYGGGTGLPTQRECLEMMGCYGKGKVLKLAEIMAGVVVAGELS